MDFIGYYHIEDDSLCDGIISYFEETPDKGPGEVGNDSIINTSQKDSTDTVFEGPLLEEYKAQLFKCIDQYKETYKYCNLNMRPWSVWPHINIQRYNPGQYYKLLHCERNCGYGYIARRHLVFMTYLNDVTDGGETLFYYQGVKVKPRKGLTLIWPADWTHTHCGVVSPTQTKYIVTGWISFEPHDQFIIY